MKGNREPQSTRYNLLTISGFLASRPRQPSSWAFLSSSSGAALVLVLGASSQRRPRRAACPRVAQCAAVSFFQQLGSPIPRRSRVGIRSKTSARAGKAFTMSSSSEYLTATLMGVSSGRHCRPKRRGRSDERPSPAWAISTPRPPEAAFFYRTPRLRHIGLKDDGGSNLTETG